MREGPLAEPHSRTGKECAIFPFLHRADPGTATYALFLPYYKLMVLFQVLTICETLLRIIPAFSCCMGHSFGKC